MWHVSSRSGVANLVNCYTLVTYNGGGARSARRRPSLFSTKTATQVQKYNIQSTKQRIANKIPTRTNTHTYARLRARLTALCPGLPEWAGTWKVKPIWILLKQETVSGSGISWAMYKSAPRSRQIATPAPHHSVFLWVGRPSCRPTKKIPEMK